MSKAFVAADACRFLVAQPEVYRLKEERPGDLNQEVGGWQEGLGQLGHVGTKKRTANRLRGHRVENRHTHTHTQEGSEGDSGTYA